MEEERKWRQQLYKFFASPSRNFESISAVGSGWWGPRSLSLETGEGVLSPAQFLESSAIGFLGWRVRVGPVGGGEKRRLRKISFGVGGCSGWVMGSPRVCSHVFWVRWRVGNRGRGYSISQGSGRAWRWQMGVKNGPRLVGWVWPGPDCRPMNHGLDDFVSSCCKGFLHNVSQILWEFKINMRRKCFLYSCLRIIHFYFFVHLCCHSVSILWTWWNFKNHLYSIRHLWLNSLTWFCPPLKHFAWWKQ